MCEATTQGLCQAAPSHCAATEENRGPAGGNHLPISTNDELVLEMNLNILISCLVLFPLHQIPSGSYFY